MSAIFKVCPGCGKRLSILSFYKHPRMKDGRFSKCKQCVEKARRSRGAVPGLPTAPWSFP